jgi:hypothetical protein
LWSRARIRRILGVAARETRRRMTTDHPIRRPSSPARAAASAAPMALALAVILAGGAGCARKAETAAATATKAAAPATPAATPAVSAALAAATEAATTPITREQMPAPRAGLWERSMRIDAKAPVVERRCLAGQPMDPLAISLSCAKAERRRTATGGVEVDAECTDDGLAVRLHLSAEGDFSSAYATVRSQTILSPHGPPLTTTNRSSFKYLGPCPAG